jgi:hypothetical protein
MSNPVLEPGASRDEKDEETIREEVVNTTPKDMRFWLVMVSLLFATFISALDLTGKVICLFNLNTLSLSTVAFLQSHKYSTSYHCPCLELAGFYLGW